MALRCASTCATLMEPLWASRATKRVVGLDMAYLRSRVSAAVQRAALTRTGPTRDHDRGSASLPTGSHDV